MWSTNERTLFVNWEPAISGERGFVKLLLLFVKRAETDVSPTR